MAWSYRMAACAVVAVVLSGPRMVSAQRPKLNDVKFIQSFEGSDEAKALLAEQGFVVTAQQFPQIFSAYINEDGPPFFITEDSAWHTYHVLLEDGVRQFEEDQIATLRQFSSRLVDVTRARSQQRGDVYWDLAAFAAVGLALQDPAAVPGEFQAVATEVAKSVTEEVNPVSALFFGLPLAPERFRAVSFYTKNAALGDFFRARQWYASCAFRLKSKAETERALHLALLVDGDRELKELYEQLTRPYDMFLGPTDDSGVPQYVALSADVIGAAPSSEQIAARLDMFCERAASLPLPKINDQLLDPAQYAQYAIEIQGFRLLPARICPSAVVMQGTVDPQVPGRDTPSGLDFFATGDLACEPARRALSAVVSDPATLKAILGAPTEPLPDSLHGQALGILRLLQEPLPAQAPQPLRTAAWQDKQLWTALAAWAEQRHTWARHVKPVYSVSNGAPQPPGYVSPYPKFFSALGKLARQTATAFSPDPEVSKSQRAGRQLLRSLETVRKAHEESRWGEHSMGEYVRLSNFCFYFVKSPNTETSGREDAETPAKLLERADLIERTARRWIAGDDLDEHNRSAVDMWSFQRPDTVELLQGLADVCDRLAVLAQKELDGQPFDRDDTYFIEDYGRKLAHLHSYTSEAYMSPVDDLPQVTPVHVNPNTNQTLYAGVARPEAVYVILEVNGERVLHRGAVLSYREFTQSTQQPLDDTIWLNRVRSGQPPSPPAFTKSFRCVTPAEEAAASALMQKWSTGEEEITSSQSPAVPGDVTGLIVVCVAVAAVAGLLLLVGRKRKPSEDNERSSSP